MALVLNFQKKHCLAGYGAVRMLFFAAAFLEQSEGTKGGVSEDLHFTFSCIIVLVLSSMHGLKFRGL